MSNARTVKIRSYIDIQEEYVLSGIVKPGYLLAIASTNLATYHAVSGGIVPTPMFAQENEFLGKTIDTAYAVGERLQVWIPTRGDVVNAVLKKGQNIVIGDALVSNGDGTLKKYVASGTGVENSGAIIGLAMEAVSLIATAAVDTHIAVRIA